VNLTDYKTPAADSCALDSLVEAACPAASAVEVRVARSVEDVEAIREVWSSWKGHRDSDIDFCLRFVWSRPEVIRPHVIVIYRAGHADAMLVGRLERSQMKSQIGYLHLPGISSRSLMFSYGGLLGNPSPENTKALVGSIVSVLRQGEADMAMLDHPTVGSPLYENVLLGCGFATRDHCVRPESHSVMALPASVEELYRSFSQGLRAEIRRKKKKLLADFGEGVVIRCYRAPEELESALPAVEDIARNTYQRGLGVGFQDTPQMRQRLSFCAEKGWLRIYVLAISGKPCAFWVGTLSNSVFVSDYNAYDPKFRDYSVGTYLLAEVVEDFCDEGVKAVDFGFGEAEYKSRFANVAHAEASLRIFAPKPRGVALNLVRTATGLMDDTLRKALERTDLLPKIRRFWRARLAKHVAAQDARATEAN
jgi:Acetyltransferase (GNAT) domain